MKYKALLLFCFAWVVTLNLQAKLFTYTIKENSFSIWIPDDAPVIKGIYFVLPYLSGDTRPKGSDFFTDIASYYDFAYMGMNPYLNINSSAESKMILDLLDTISKQSGHPEIKNAPMVLTGTSMGGRASYYLTSYIPDRIIAYSGYRPAIQNSDYPNTNILNSKVPALFNPGQYDFDFYRNIDTVFHRIRAFNGQAAMLLGWGADHQDNCSDTYFLMYYFINKLIEARYPWEKNPLNDTVTLKNIPMEDGWLADHSTWNPVTKIYPYNQYPEISDKIEASWLPTNDIAYVYKAASSWRDSSMTCISQQNKLQIFGSDFGHPERDSSFLVSITNHGISAIDTIQLYDGSQLLSTGKSDSFATKLKQEAGMHMYWGRAIDSDKKEYFTTTMMSWVSKGKYNPLKQPAFNITGRVDVMVNFDTLITIKPFPCDTIPIDYYTISPKSTEIAEMFFDSITGILTFHSKPESFGMQIFHITSHNRENPLNTYPRSISLVVNRDLQFKVDSQVITYRNFKDTLTIKVAPKYNYSNVVYSINPSTWSRAKLQFDSLTGTLKFTSIKDRYGETKFTITASDRVQPDNIYSQTIIVKVKGVSDIDSKVGNTDQFNIYPNPATDWIIIQPKEPIQLKKLSIIDIQGKIIYSENHSTMISAPISLNISQFTEGLYFLGIQTSTKTTFHKIIIQK